MGAPMACKATVKIWRWYAWNVKIDNIDVKASLQCENCGQRLVQKGTYLQCSKCSRVTKYKTETGFEIDSLLKEGINKLELSMTSEKVAECFNFKTKDDITQHLFALDEVLDGYNNENKMKNVKQIYNINNVTQTNTNW